MLETAAPPLPRLLTAHDLAEQFDSLSRQRLYELVRENRIPHVKIGRSVRFSAPKVAAWLDAGGTAADEPV